MSMPEEFVRKDIAKAYGDASRTLDERVPDQVRQAILAAAARQIATPAAHKVSFGQGLVEGLKRRFLGPWPFAAATAMLAVLAVTVALRVVPEAQSPGNEAQSRLPAPASPAAPAVAAAPAPAQEVSKADAAPAPAPAPAVARAGAARESDPSSAPAKKAPPAALPDRAGASSPAPAPSAPSTPLEASAPSAFPDATSAAKARPGASASPTPSPSPSPEQSADREHRPSGNKVAPSWLALLSPSQKRSTILAILAEHGARALRPHEGESDEAAATERRASSGADAVAAAGAAPAMPAAAADTRSEREAAAAPATRASRKLAPAPEYELVFRLPDERRLSCRFKKAEAGAEDLLVRCVPGLAP